MVLAVGGGASASALFKRRECYVCSRDGGSGVGCSSIWLPPDGDERSRRKRRSGMHRSAAEGRREAVKAAAAFWRQEPVLEMESICDTEQLDQILTSSQQEEAIVIEWMAAWCRKCIYLKPKLEKLAAEFHPKVKFYSIDVNKVSQSLIKRGNISKMPTIQLWKDGEMKEEIIGGHKAWLVVEEVREMIKNNI